MNHMSAAIGYEANGVRLASLVEAVEVGNEVDLYYENGIRQKDYS